MSLPRFFSVKIHRDHYSTPSAHSVGGLLPAIVAVLTILISTSSCAASRMQHVDQASILDLPVVKPAQSSPLSDVMNQLQDARVVFVGETHTRYDHHLVQLEVLRHLYQKNPEIALGVEWFQQPFQQHLDDYIAGKISEKEMLYRTEYFSRWKYNYRHYRPILQFARDNNIPVIALNTPRELTKALAHAEPDDLPEDLKAHLPADYDWSDKAYEKHLRDIFELHPEYKGEFDNFLRSQLTWDESMAERAAQYLQTHPQSRMLVLAGSGHIMHGWGIPNRIKRRIDVEQFTILVSEDYLTVTSDIADYLVMSAQQSLAPIGMIGAYLDTEGKLLKISGFSNNSAVKEAGLNKGAVIIGVDDEGVENFTDFKYAILDKKAGDTIELHYLEDAEAGEKDRKSISIKLR